MVYYNDTMENKEQQVTVSYLEQARLDWLQAKAAAERAGHMSAALNNLEAESMGRVDALLEELHALGSVALLAEGIEHGK